jgi:hypothetical protein
MRPAGADYLEFVRLPAFERSSKGELTEDEIRAMEDGLPKNAASGDRIPGACGVRKVRAAVGDRGKRGGARVVYYYQESRARIFLILAYPKNKKTDLTENEKKAVCKLVGLLNAEG